jgi:hypothetical protein
MTRERGPDRIEDGVAGRRELSSDQQQLGVEDVHERSEHPWDADPGAERAHGAAAIAGRDTAVGITERVMYPENVTVDPGLTLAMNDDRMRKRVT